MQNKFIPTFLPASNQRIGFDDVEKYDSKKQNVSLPIGAILLSGTLSYILVRLSSSVESITQIPGISSFVIALLGSSLSQCVRNLRRFTNDTSSRRWSMIQPCLGNIGNVSSILSTVAFHFFFASVGASANLSEAVFKGPAAFIFGLIVISIHVLVTLFVPFSVNKAFRLKRLKWPWIHIFGYLPLSFEEIMIGSNAAIGGPTTAASLGARMNLSNLDCTNEVNRNAVRKALIFSGLICGIIGYATATNIGVSLGLFLLDKKARLL
jgi:Na+/glutamate symporter